MGALQQMDAPSGRSGFAGLTSHHTIAPDRLMLFSGDLPASWLILWMVRKEMTMTGE